MTRQWIDTVPVPVPVLPSPHHTSTLNSKVIKVPYQICQILCFTSARPEHHDLPASRGHSPTLCHVRGSRSAPFGFLSATMKSNSRLASSAMSFALLLSSSPLACESRRSGQSLSWPAAYTPRPAGKQLSQRWWLSDFFPSGRASVSSIDSLAAHLFLSRLEHTLLRPVPLLSPVLFLWPQTQHRQADLVIAPRRGPIGPPRGPVLYAFGPVPISARVVSLKEGAVEPGVSVIEGSITPFESCKFLRDGDEGRPRAHNVNSFGPAIAVCECILV